MIVKILLLAIAYDCKNPTTCNCDSDDGIHL